MRINIPPVTRGLLAITIALSFLYAVARWTPAVAGSNSNDSPRESPLVSYLALVPSAVLMNPWTLVTATFVEQNVVTLIINGSTIFFGGKYLERAWGSRDFALVVLIATVVPNLLMIPTYITWGAIMRNTERAVTPITGAITLQAAFLVAFKQLVPEHTVSVYKGMVKMRVKHFPAIFLLLNTISGLLLGTDTALFLSWYGLVTTWIYLRFYKRQPDISAADTGGQDLKGDASDTFAFATFFPNVVQPPIAAACNQLYALLCNLKVVQPFSDEAIATGNEQAAARGEGGLPSLINQPRGVRGMSKREEAERRRALALKALDQRLSTPSQKPATSSIPQEGSTGGHQEQPA